MEMELLSDIQRIPPNFRHGSSCCPCVPMCALLSLGGQYPLPEVELPPLHQCVCVLPKNLKDLGQVQLPVERNCLLTLGRKCTRLEDHPFPVHRLRFFQVPFIVAKAAETSSVPISTGFGRYNSTTPHFHHSPCAPCIFSGIGEAFSTPPNVQI